MTELNFKQEMVQTLDLETLKSTYQELDPSTGVAARGIFHYELIERIMELAVKAGLQCSITDIFAAQNKDRYAPGVTLVKHIADQLGDTAPQAHTLRRVFTTLHISDLENDESDTGLAIAYHQAGIQLAIGPNVKICKNQCILSPERTITTYGNNKVTDINKLLQIVDDWFMNHGEQRTRDIEVMDKMRNIHLSYREMAELTGHLSFYRVGVDAGLIKVPTYPLNNGQINQMTENYLRAYEVRQKSEREDKNFTLWEIYNMATELYKPDSMNIPSVIQQNVAWTRYLTDKFKL